jgi:hypothetical protein
MSAGGLERKADPQGYIAKVRTTVEEAQQAAASA